MATRVAVSISIKFQDHNGSIGYDTLFTAEWYTKSTDLTE